MKKGDQEDSMDFDDKDKSRNVDQSSTPGIKIGGQVSDSAIDIESINLTDEGDGDENFKNVDI